MRLTISYLLILLSAFALFSGCSGNQGGDVISPILPTKMGLETGLDSHRVLWGIWDTKYDQNNGTIEVNSLRSGFAHFNVTDALLPPSCSDCLTIEVNSFNTVTRILDASVTLKNPTQLTGHDVRGILYTTSYGHELTNPDAWTDLWDIPGGENINPFRIFAKNEPDFEFKPEAEHSENYLLKIPIPPGWAQISFAVDASWPGNCLEPYMIHSFSHTNLMNEIGSSAICTVKISDWQEDVEEVRIGIPEITGEESTYFALTGGSVWECDIVNNTGVGPGRYECLITAISAGTGTTDLFQKVDITISGGWAASWSGDEFYFDQGTGVDVDPDGNLYTTGLYSGTADFDPGPGICERDEAEDGNAFLLKFNNQGEFQWVLTWGGTVSVLPDILPTAPTDAAVDDNGYVYIAGLFTKDNDFDPGPGEDLRSPTHGEWGCFLMKFDYGGNFFWARTWGGANDNTDETDGANEVAVSPYGEIYVTGHFVDTVDFDPGDGVDNHTAFYGKDIFLIKFNADGEFQWARTWGGSLGYGIYAWMESGNAVEVDSQGNVVVAGFFGDTVDFDPSTGVDEHSTDQGAFVSKFDSSGQFLWAKTWGQPGDGETKATGLAIDTWDNIYVSGHFLGTVDFDPGDAINEMNSNGETDAFLMKFNSSGDHLWASSWGNSTFQVSQGLATYGDSSIYVSGYFEDTVDFDPGPEINTSASNGEVDSYISKFNPDGSFVWVNTWGGTGLEVALDTVASNTDAAITVGVYMSSEIDLDLGEGVDTHYNSGVSSVYLLKFPPDGTW